MSYSYKGKILISTPDIMGDIFSRAVVLIIEHNDEGAFGLILNKKSEALSENVSEFLEYDTEIYEGGPVEKERYFFIVKNHEDISPKATRINDEFFFTEDMQAVISALTQEKIHLDEIKAFSGYSGWSALQLDKEVDNKLWTVVDVYNLDYTFPNDHTLWKSIMQNLGGEYLLWANSPSNIYLN
ncbi:transcriptional regulator [Chryseobacterium sp. Leaf180]|uniref:YqgE/AlgH family protein n=1 Tax=Chryseobacterium sp. Leaf180 TaxID=1736289 RepID=UPI0006F3DCF8|nr:YqgE/AlgH family protein [Chryseobacterium sp. Leaf180]KQR92003.1 transcriptional regulator [Chryseobacterium sp. Leaf180]